MKPWLSRSGWSEPVIYLAAALLFILVVATNFTKPFGFFRESNPALVAINATYWQQNPDVRKQHIPVASYAFDKTAPPATQFDNTITTFGYAWFEVPYWFIEITRMQPGPVALRLFSVLWLALTMLFVFKLAVLLAAAFGHNRRTVIITILLYLFSPVVLWYQVNGYVHETAVLPFYYGGWYCFFQLLLQRKQRWLWLTAVFLFTGIQFDWLPFFQATAMCGYLLFSRKEQLPRWMFLVPALAVVSGIGYIIYTYSSRTSLQDYFHFMSWKFSSRTVGRSGHSFLPFWPTSLNIVLFYILSYGLLLVWVVTALVRKRVHTFIVVMLITALLHHIVFWGFSSEHDYASLKSAFPLVFTAAVFLAGLSARTASYLVALTIACGIGQYFFLHNFSFRKGIQADDSFSYRAGEMVRRRPPGETVFLNTSGVYYPQVEFYAGRPYRLAEDVQDALKQLNIQNNDTTSVPGATSKSVFIDVNNRRIFPLNRSPR